MQNKNPSVALILLLGVLDASGQVNKIPLTAFGQVSWYSILTNYKVFQPLMNIRIPCYCARSADSNLSASDYIYVTRSTMHIETKCSTHVTVVRQHKSSRNAVTMVVPLSCVQRCVPASTGLNLRCAR